MYTMLAVNLGGTVLRREKTFTKLKGFIKEMYPLARVILVEHGGKIVMRFDRETDEIITNQKEILETKPSEMSEEERKFFRWGWKNSIFSKEDNPY